ncbi:hypothetical protein AB1L88_11695 [Tautonia sp. JC769]|uniref:hypothetical protein n=1 Tax=Tautonia sp. JC769 TaxID=3232135 RepID=UPI00345B1643
MPWKRRRGGLCYFYESRREGRRVRTVYLGSGASALRAAESLVARRAARRAERQSDRARREAEASADRAFNDLFNLSRTLAEWALRAAGFHRPNRGPWRRRRRRRRSMSETTPKTTPAPVEPLELRRMMERAMLDRVVNSATGQGRDPDDRAMADRFKADLLSFAGELAGPDPSPIVRALAFSASVAYFDWLFAGFHPRGDARRDRAIDRAEKRLQRALKTLHTVQRHLPESFMALQINVDARHAEGRPPSGMASAPEQTRTRTGAS